MAYDHLLGGDLPGTEVQLALSLVCFHPDTLQPMDQDTEVANMKHMSSSNSRPSRVCKASTSHVIMVSHACALAALQCSRSGSFREFGVRAEENAAAVTPVGAWLIRACKS